MMQHGYVLVLAGAEEFRVQVVALLAGGLGFFNRRRMRYGPGVVTDTGDLPGNFEPWRAASDLEAVLVHFFGYVDSGARRADRSKLVLEAAVQRVEPIGHGDRGFAFGVEHHGAVVD